MPAAPSEHVRAVLLHAYLVVAGQRQRALLQCGQGEPGPPGVTGGHSCGGMVFGLQYVGSAAFSCSLPADREVERAVGMTRAIAIPTGAASAARKWQWGTREALQTKHSLRMFE